MFFPHSAFWSICQWKGYSLSPSPRLRYCWYPMRTKPYLLTRGGVEDTRLEAKAKDTKKIRGQGQPFRGQTLSRPRTRMLEAMAKDQGHKRKCSPKKKMVFTKIFQAISKKKKGLHRNFSSDLHKKTFSKKFFKRFTKF